MNKEKVFIEGHEVGFLVDTTGVREKKIQVASGEIVSIDERFIYKSIEREKVAIPQFVADYIEFKKKNNFHVYGAMRTIEDHYDKKVPNWFYEGNIEKFCLAWILGYEVKKERRYIVTLKSSGQKLYYHTKDDEYIFAVYAGALYSEYHTKTDLEENDMSWVFDCHGMEIQEVE